MIIIAASRDVRDMISSPPILNMLHYSRDLNRYIQFMRREQRISLISCIPTLW